MQIVVWAGWRAATGAAIGTACAATGAAAPIDSALPNELETVMIVLLHQRTFIPNSMNAKTNINSNFGTKISN